MDKEKFEDSIAVIINSLRASGDKIGAQRSTWRLLPKRLADLSGKFESGRPISSVEIQELKQKWLSEDPLIDENGNPFVFYIHDFSYFWSGVPRVPNRVFHVAWCATLEKMDKAGRKERYVKKTDLSNNDFRVDYGRDRKGIEHLPACYNCQDKMKRKVAPARLYYDRNNLDMVRFFRLYGRQDLINLDNPMYSVDYPKNWPQISKRIREERGNKCEAEGDHSGGLEVHHINGNPGDITSSNLRVLCHKHHANQPLHEHMR